MNIEREISISNTDSIIKEAIKNSNFDFIRIDINTKSIDNENILLDLVKNIDHNINLFIIVGNDFDFNNDIKNSEQLLVIFLKNKIYSKIIETLKQRYNKFPLQQIVATETLLKVIKNNNNADFNSNNAGAIIIQSKYEDAFIFNEKDYFTSQKFVIPFGSIKKYQRIMEEQRAKYQIRDILFSL